MTQTTETDYDRLIAHELADATSSERVADDVEHEEDYDRALRESLAADGAVVEMADGRRVYARLIGSHA